MIICVQILMLQIELFFITKLHRLAVLELVYILLQMLLHWVTLSLLQAMNSRVSSLEQQSYFF